MSASCCLGHCIYFFYPFQSFDFYSSVTEEVMTYVSMHLAGNHKFQCNQSRWSTLSHLSSSHTRVSWCFQSVSYFFHTWQAVKQSHHNIFFNDIILSYWQLPRWYRLKTLKNYLQIKAGVIKIFLWVRECFFLDNLSVNYKLGDKSYFESSGLLEWIPLKCCFCIII